MGSHERLSDREQPPELTLGLQGAPDDSLRAVGFAQSALAPSVGLDEAALRHTSRRSSGQRRSLHAPDTPGGGRHTRSQEWTCKRGVIHAATLLIPDATLRPRGSEVCRPCLRDDADGRDQYH